MYMAKPATISFWGPISFLIILWALSHIGLLSGDHLLTIYQFLFCFSRHKEFSGSELFRIVSKLFNAQVLILFGGNKKKVLQGHFRKQYHLWTKWHGMSQLS